MQVPDLKDQIRTYYESTTEPTDIDGFVDALLGQESDGAEVIVGPFGTRTRSPMPDQSPAPWYRSLIGIAAAILTAVAIGVIAFTIASGPDDEVADSTEITAPPPPASASEFTEAEALAVVEEYFAAFERGDVEAIDALFEKDATVGITGTSGRDEYVRLDAWDIGQGGQRANRECTPEGSTVLCSYDDLQGIAAIVGAPPTHWEVTFAVSPDGAITDLQGSTPGFLYDRVNDPFKRWMQQNHPDLADPTDCCGGDTIDTSLTNGALRLEYGQLWAAYLEENGCEYDQACIDSEMKDALAVVDRFYSALEVGDVAGALALLARDATLSSDIAITPEQVERFIEWRHSQGLRIMNRECTVTPTSAGVASVSCAFESEDALAAATGAPHLPGNGRFAVEAGSIVTMTERYWRAIASSYMPEFSNWMDTFHPDLAADATYFGRDEAGTSAWDITIEEARQRGETRREYAELWADYLEENGCTWDQPCEP